MGGLYQRRPARAMPYAVRGPRLLVRPHPEEARRRQVCLRGAVSKEEGGPGRGGLALRDASQRNRGCGSCCARSRCDAPQREAGRDWRATFDPPHPEEGARETARESWTDSVACARLEEPAPAQAGDEGGHRSRVYSAAARAAASPGSTLAAQYLNSGIFPNGSSAGLVSRFAAASTKANGMNTTPSGMASSCLAASSIVPRRVVTRMRSPGLMPSLAMVPRERFATAPGSSASSVDARRVMAPVCQCSSWRPVESTNG